MNIALPGHRPIPETSFPPEIFALIFLSSTDSVMIRLSLPQNTNTRLASGQLFSFQMGLQPDCRRAVLQKDFWLAPADPWLSSHAENNDAVRAPGPIAQGCQPWPSTPEALHEQQSHCCCNLGSPRTTYPQDVSSCSGDNGGLLLPLLLPHLQSQHCPAVQVWEEGKWSGINTGPKLQGSSLQPVLSEGCKDTPDFSTVHLCCLPISHPKAEVASPTASILPCSSTYLCLCPHARHPMAKGSSTTHTPLPAGQTPQCFSAQPVPGNTNQMCLRPPHAAAPQQTPET